MFDVNWDTRSHADIHAQLQGRGAGFTDAGGAWNSLATRLRDVAGSVERATSGIAATRSGPAAQAAGSAVGPMGPWADEVRGFSDAVGSASHEQNRALAATRGAVGPPVPRPPVTLQTWEGVGALAALDVDSAEHASADAERRARAAMGRYQEFSSLRASGLPQFSSPGQGAPRIQLVAGEGAVPTAGGAASRPGAATPGSGGTPGAGGAVPTPAGAAGGAPAGGPAGGGAATAPGSALPGAGPTADGGGTTASPRPGSSGALPPPGPAGGSGALPGPGAAGTGGTGGPGPSRPGLPGAALPAGATGPGAGTGSAAPRPGAPGAAPVFGPSGSTGTGAGSGAVGSGLAGPGSSVIGSTLGNSTGTAGGGSFGGGTVGSSAAGSAPTRAAVEPTRPGGASVLEPALAPRGASTNPGVPFAPVGGVGAGAPTEQRLSRASYLVEDDPDALAGELPRVAPPVIGA